MLCNAINWEFIITKSLKVDSAPLTITTVISQTLDVFIAKKMIHFTKN